MTIFFADENFLLYGIAEKAREGEMSCLYLIKSF